MQNRRSNFLSNRWSNKITIPLAITIIGGAVVALFQLVIPKWIGAKNELSHVILYRRDPILDRTIEPPRTLYQVNVDLWNSGDNSLQNTPIFVGFRSGDNNFNIVHEEGRTIPELNFSKPVKESVDTHTVKYIFPLLKPNEGYRIIYLTSSFADVNLQVEAKNVELKTDSAPPWDNPKTDWLPIIGILVTVSLIVIYLVERYRNRSRRVAS